MKMTPIFRMPAVVLPAVALVLMFSAGNNSYPSPHRSAEPEEVRWVDSVFSTMTDRERIGQLLMIRAHSDKDAAYETEVEELIREYHIGGVCFFQGNPERQSYLTNRYHAAAGRIPLLVSMDAEWGLGMRLKGSTMSYPHQLMLGAITDNKLIYRMGREIARECRRLGVHINFAPVADINNNPANPVIHDRSFGEDKYNVTAKCFQYMMGLQDGGVMACAKHFPGHGDTNEDSHYRLPRIDKSMERLDSLELFPFRVLSQYGVASVMVAHLNIPAINGTEAQPTTLSAAAVNDLLRKKIGFQGLIITDAMEMKAISDRFSPGEADVQALEAGNDIVLLPRNVPAAAEAIARALEEGRLDRNQLYASVRRVLLAKYRVGLHERPHIEEKNIRRDLNPIFAEMLRRDLVRNALTLVRDRPGIVGFPSIEKFRFASVAVGAAEKTPFQQYAGYYAPMDHFQLGWDEKPGRVSALLDSLAGYDVVLVSLHNMRSKASQNFGISEGALSFFRALNRRTTVALTVFGSPYALRFFDDVPVLMEAYNDEELTQQYTAQALFGAMDISGVLPVTASPMARYGQGVRKLYRDYRLGYDIPESVGFDRDTLALIDRMVEKMIAEGAAPGCQILVAKNGKVVWNKAYGFYTYEKEVPVTTETLFDLASVTKVAATTISLMRLTDEKKLDILLPAAKYLPELDSTNKKDIPLLDMLAHHARLTPWIPFYTQTLKKPGMPSPELYRKNPATGFQIPVAPDLYLSDRYVDSIWSQIIHSDLRPKPGYKYSDLGLYLAARAVERSSGMSLDQYADQTFYRPLGLATTCFNPWRYGLAKRCAPTEEDRYFRGKRIQGYVHDMGAAMLGGVAGHAGLFSNANDLAKIFQMLLNGGTYFGKPYLKPGTVNWFTSRYEGCSRRGIGFDMKELDVHASANMCYETSDCTFGHLGFTGNAVWADPEYDLVFIFLSNRTYPGMTNNKLINGNYRPLLQSIVYRAIVDKRGFPAP